MFNRPFFGGQVFLKYYHVEQLNSAVSEFARRVATCQKCVRALTARRRYATMKQAAVKCEQDMRQLNDILTELTQSLTPQQQQHSDEDAKRHEDERRRAKEEEEWRKAEKDKAEEEKRKAEEKRKLEEQKKAEREENKSAVRSCSTVQLFDQLIIRSIKPAISILLFIQLLAMFSKLFKLTFRFSLKLTNFRWNLI